MLKYISVIFIGIIIVFSGICVLFFIENKNLKISIEEMDKRKESGFKQELKIDKELIRENLDIKYHADMVLYEAAAKQLEIEKEKVRELADRVNGSVK